MVSIFERTSLFLYKLVETQKVSLLEGENNVLSQLGL